jgi:predicted metal-dependent HD superfamily phosphohydrolase
MTASLLQRWRALAGGDCDSLGLKLIAAWEEPHRHYHSTSHLIWLLDEAERRASLIHDRAFIGYAIWFHDAIYVIGGKETDHSVWPDNETRSAAWARGAIADKALGDRVARVIEMTRKHHEGEADGDAALFLDMDMAVLGEPWEAYCAYAAGVRREFKDYPDGAFAAGRWRWLDQQLERPRTFRTDLYETERGETARANMRWEREEVRRGRMVNG